MYKIFSYIVLIAPLLSVLAVSSGYSGDAVATSEVIRVAIAKDLDSIAVAGDALRCTDENGQSVLLTSPIVVKIGANRNVMVNDLTGRKLVFSSGSAISVNGKHYRGVLDITNDNKALLVVNELPLENYLAGVINAEISSAWPMDAIKAQAVIARTYAVSRKNIRKNAMYHLESSAVDQVYGGSDVEDARSLQGVNETAGEVLTYKGALIQAFYHSSCGGKTEASENVWGMNIPYLHGVDCQYCKGENSFEVWSQRLTLKQLEGRLVAAGFKASGITDIKVGALNSRGRLKDLVIITPHGKLFIQSNQFRKAIGFGVIKSTNFTVKSSNGELVFTGRGNGHGVGLCQWGAKQHAEAGTKYPEILLHYYPATELKKLADIR